MYTHAMSLGEASKPVWQATHLISHYLIRPPSLHLLGSAEEAEAQCVRGQYGGATGWHQSLS